MRSILWGGVLAAGAAVVFSSTLATGGAASAASEVAAVLQEADPHREPGTLGDLLERSAKIASLGKSAEGEMRKFLAADDPFWRLVAAASLLESSAQDPTAVAALDKAVRDGTPPTRLLALAVLERFPGNRTLPALAALSRTSGMDAAFRAEAAASWWRVARHPEARQILLSIVQDPAASQGARRAAVLGAAEAQGIPAVRKELERLALEPSIEGRLARSLLEKDQAVAVMGVRENPAFLGREAVLEEMVATVQKHYVDEKRVSVESLFDAVGKGIAASLDRHCEYMTPEEAKESEEMFRGEYAGVGAQVEKDEAGYIQIATAFFSGPAYNAGIRTGDRITKIEGESVQELSLTEGVKRLRGPPGSTVTIEVIRAGWQEPQKFTLARGTIQRETVFWESLPGGIGYLRLVQFGEKSYQEFSQALDALEKEGMKGLVIDLRANGGGLLDAAVSITSQFLPSGALVVYTEGRSPDYGQREEYQAGGAYYQYFARSGGQIQQFRDWLNPAEAKQRGLRPISHKIRPPYPIAILTDKSSASASEIFAGAMRAHGRAFLVGATTYGKGSVQRELPLSASRRVNDGATEQARLKITIAKYFLKDGVSIHGIGVKPDIEASVPEMEGWKFAAHLKLVTSGAFKKFFDAWYVKDKARYEQLLASGAPANDYPGYGAWAKEVAPEGLPDKDLFHLFRLELRKRIMSEIGKPFPLEIPLEEDVPLQRAMVELGAKAGIDLAAFKEYASFKDKFGQEKNPPPAPK